MPAWWSKKSSKSKEDGHQTQVDNQSPHAHQSKFTSFSGKSDGRYNNSNNNSKRRADKDKPRSFDEALISRNSPRCSKEFGAGGGSSGFSGFDSDSAHPLPRPSISSMQSDLAVGLGSGSASVSSVSSSGSSEDHVIIGNDHGPSVGYRSRVDPRVNGENKLNTGWRSPVPGSRSPVTASRGATSPTSPLHPRLSPSTSVDSPTGRPEDGRSQAHKLPLPPGSPSSPSALPSSPTFLAKWRKGRLLGRGTFGHVYLGFNSESGQMCAIKEVRVDAEDSGLKESLKQLSQEINLLSQLSQPNIVRYYGSELGDEALSVYLEYVSGGSIHKLLQEYGPFREPVIQNYTRQILSGLAYLHGRNTVHRDIKGANILVDPNGEIKLADFGMAKHITAYSSMLSFKGSPYWMAPEVVMNTNGYSLAVDIWSLGCTILEMAAAKPPWSQYEGVAAIFKIGNSKDMPDIPDHLSNEAKNFIRLCLQRDPLARPSAAQLLEHPFLRDQVTTRVANANLTRDAFPYAFDGSRTPPALDVHSGRQNMSTTDGDYAARTLPVLSRTSRNARDSVRTITSLPVSPCSSPLRNGTTQRTGFLSPPHPAYPLVGPGQNGYNISDYPVSYPIRQNMRYAYDPLIETSPLRSHSHTPGTSPCRPN